jgi:AAA domain
VNEEERRYLLGSAALRLACDQRAYQALTNGVPVLRSRLNADLLAAVGEPLEGEPLELDEMLALRVEATSPHDSRPGGDAVGTRTVSPSGEKGKTAIASPRPDVVGTRDGTRSFSPDSVSVDLRFVTAAVFATVAEPGSEPLVRFAGNVLIPEGGDVMFYGDGGAGKTTLMIDLGLHLAGGDEWLGIGVRSARVAIVENEGPRPLFRAKLRRKLDAWEGSPLEDRLLLLEEPWSRVSLDEPAVRDALAGRIAELELDALLVGPVTRSGMNEAGTLQQVRDYANLLSEIRNASGRRVTFLLAHHENRGGQVSGAWEGAVDTLFHVQAQGNGQTRLYVQKARWSPEHHKQKIQLAWVDGEGFAVLESEERDDNTLADEILRFVLANGGCGWNKVNDAVAGKGGRLRGIRDNLLAGGRLVNQGTEARMKLWHADDPALPATETLLDTVDDTETP